MFHTKWRWKTWKCTATWAETALLLSVTISKEANGIGCEVVLTHGEKGVGGGKRDFYILAFCSFLALPSVREKSLLQFPAAGIVSICWDTRSHKWVGRWNMYVIRSIRTARVEETMCALILLIKRHHCTSRSLYYLVDYIWSWREMCCYYMHICFSDLMLIILKNYIIYFDIYI